MKISELLSENMIKLELENTEKTEIIKELVGLLDENDILEDKEGYLKSVIEREQVGSTGIGEGIAIPHSRSAVVKKVAIAFIKSKKGVNFSALDGKPVHLFFIIAAPLDAGNVYLKVLSKLSQLLRNPDFREELKNASSKKDILNIINQHEKQL